MTHRHDDPSPRWGGPGWGPRPGWAPPWAQGGPGAWGRSGPGPWGQPGPSGIRIGNAERTEVTNALVRHMAEGRLSEEELEERLAKANAAKTAEDLQPLLADLPPLSDGGEVAAPRRRVRGRSIVLWALAAVVALSALSWVGRVAHHGPGFGVFFPPFPLILLGVLVFVLLRRRRWHHR